MANVETWFDTRDGALLIGEAAIEERLIEGGTFISPLRDLLLAKEIPVRTGDFPKVESHLLSNDDYLQLGSWVFSLIQDPKDEWAPVQKVTEKVLQRLFILGLGPERRSYTRPERFGSITSFQSLIGSPVNYPNGIFDSWTTDDFVRHALLIAKHRGRRPTLQDYDDYAKNVRTRRVPGYQVIQDRFGGIAKLNELAGYPDTSKWNKNQFIQFGVTLMRNKVGRTFDIDLINELSAEKKGPSLFRIIRVFGTWDRYIELVKRVNEQSMFVNANQSPSK